MMTGPIRYSIDAADRITWVLPEWETFAAANFWPGRRVIGTELWSHITDPSTRHIYQALVGRVRGFLRAFKIPFRCDSPDVRRYLELTIEPGVGGTVNFTSEAKRIEPRVHVTLLDPN